MNMKSELPRASADSPELYEEPSSDTKTVRVFSNNGCQQFIGVKKYIVGENNLLIIVDSNGTSYFREWEAIVPVSE